MRRSACHPMRSARPDRTGACRCTGGTCSRQRDFDWLRDRARRNADLFDGYRVDHLVGFYRTYFRPHDGSAGTVHPRGAGCAARARRARARRLQASRGRRSSPRISASSPTSSARRSRGCRSPATRCSGGSASGTRRASRFRDPVRVSGRLGRHVGHARHRADGDLVGGRAARRARGGARDSVGAPAAHRGGSRRALDAPGAAARRARSAARNAVRVRLRHAHSADSATSSAGAIASTSPRRLATANWTWRLPWPVGSTGDGARGDGGREAVSGVVRASQADVDANGQARF